ncbi:hypothetical protein KLP28_07990 [Nocardioidaceae bacterium]|nr:hypothetical protein KLP28_07990 [Nocardioidaceae bacterium]
MTAILLTVLLGPALVGAVLALPVPVPGRDRFAPSLGVGVLGVSAVASYAVVDAGTTVTAPFVAGADLGLAATGPAQVLLPMILVVAMLVMVVATAVAETRQARFVGMMLLFAAAATLTVLASTLPTLLLGWELMGAASYALIGYRHRDPGAVGSGATAFLTTRAADLGLYVAVAAALAGRTDLSLDALTTTSPGWLDVVAAGVLVAALGKAAQLPFSFWLSRAMDGPSPVSALLHSAAMVALGGYLLVRLSPLLAATGWAGPVTAWAGVTTAVALGLVALAQTDLKQLLAASTAAQLGLVVMAAGLGATAAGTAHLVAHAAVKSLLFLAAGAWLHALGSKQLTTLSGAARRWPALGAVTVAALLALGGLPPLSLWATKDAVLAAAHGESLALYLAGLVATVVAVAYATLALVTLLRTPPSDLGQLPVLDDELPGSRVVPRRVPAASTPLAVAAVALGVFVLPEVLQRLPGRVPAEPTTDELVLSAVVVLLAGAASVVWLRRRSSGPGTAPPRGRARALLHGWLHLEQVIHALVVRPTLRGADLAARVDDRVLAALVTGVATGALRLARGTDRGDAQVDQGVRAVAAGARDGGRLVRRPSSTGQLHHYYQQLVVALLVLVVIVSALVLLGR